MKIRDDDSSGKMRAMLKDFSKIVNPPLEDKRPQRLRKDWKNIWEKAQIANSPVKVLYKSSAVVRE